MYTDDEVARILREAAESADSPAGMRASSTGLSLEQIKAAAAQAGLDPSTVERAALRIKKRDPESFLERAAGGPVRHRETIHLATKMSKKSSAHLLSAVRSAMEVPGEGSSDASGFSWHAWYRGNRLSVTALEESQGTRVKILLDRKAPLVQTLIWSLLAIVMSILILIADNGPPVLAAIPIGVLAARAYWKSSTRSLRERIAALLDAVRESQPTGGDEGEE